MTPSDIISDARILLQDTVAAYRHADAELLSYVNDAVGEVANLNPELFITVGDFACTTGAAEQTLGAATALRFLEVQSLSTGVAVTRMDVPTMDAFSPGWRAATAAAAVHWGEVPGSKLGFLIYPKAPASQTLRVKYVRTPKQTYTIGESLTDVPDAFQSGMVDYVVSRTLAKDDMEANQATALALYQSFAAKVKGAA